MDLDSNVDIDIDDDVDTESDLDSSEFNTFSEMMKSMSSGN
jgi:hypothetical protein